MVCVCTRECVFACVRGCMHVERDVLESTSLPKKTLLQDFLLYCTVLYCTALYYAMLHHGVLYYTVLNNYADYSIDMYKTYCSY